MKKRDIRALRQAAQERDHTDPCDDEHDGWSNVRKRDDALIPMREGKPIDPRAPWPFPTNQGALHDPVR